MDKYIVRASKPKLTQGACAAVQAGIKFDNSIEFENYLQNQLDWDVEPFITYPPKGRTVLSTQLNAHTKVLFGRQEAFLPCLIAAAGFSKEQAEAFPYSRPDAFFLTLKNNQCISMQIIEIKSQRVAGSVTDKLCSLCYTGRSYQDILNQFRLPIQAHYCVIINEHLNEIMQKDANKMGRFKLFYEDMQYWNFPIMVERESKGCLKSVVEWATSIHHYPHYHH